MNMLSGWWRIASVSSGNSVAPLLGDFAVKAGFCGHATPEGGAMVLLREADGAIFTMSDGLIELSRAFGGGSRVFSLVRLIPKWLRDGIYRWSARNRLHFMGSTKACMLPDPEFVKRLRN